MIFFYKYNFPYELLKLSIVIIDQILYYKAQLMIIQLKYTLAYILYIVR